MTLPIVTDIDIDIVFTRPDGRREDPAGVARLVESIRTIGVINPIRVRPKRLFVRGFEDDAFQVTAGAHRLRACRKLGMTTVPCIIVDDDDLHAEMAMLDENLCRSDLGTGDRDKALARRKAIYVELNPGTAAGRSQAAGMNAAIGNNVETRNVPTFAASIAKAIRRSESFVKQAVERGEKVAQEAVDLLRGTKRDAPGYYGDLKRLEPERQVEKVKRDLARDQDRKANQAAPRQPKAPRGSHVETDADRRARLALHGEELALAEHREKVARFIVGSMSSFRRKALRLLIQQSMSSDLFDPLIDALDNAEDGD